MALVVGVSEYRHAPRLANPRNDARELALRLRRFGYLVDELWEKPATKAELDAALVRLRQRSASADAVVVFFAGHGIELGGENYLIPSDARLQDERDIQREAIGLGQILAEIQSVRPSRSNLVILDACRNNPFRSQLAASGRTISRGLGVVKQAPAGTLIAFSTAPGSEAKDGDSAHSPYSAALLGVLDTEPQLDVTRILQRVRARVLASTGQQPWESSSLLQDFYLAGSGASAALGQPPVAVPTPEPKALKAGDVIKECAACPEVVVIPGGSFVLGSPATEPEREASEGPRRRASVERFLLGRREVTQGEWRAVMGVNPSRFSSCGNDCPVENVSWEEAKAYIKRLNELSGKVFRLPSEAEWEYAARAGTATPFHTGMHITTAQANFDGSAVRSRSGKGEFRERTVKGCSFDPNAFGLCDMHGNVLEWVEDVWHDSYQGAPADGRAWVTGGDPEWRILRGGSWVSEPRLLRSASRIRCAPNYRYGNAGFRIARSL